MGTGCAVRSYLAEAPKHFDGALFNYVVADHPMGPYGDGGDHARVLHGIPGHVRGPRHHSIVFAPDGKSQYVLYHAWDKNMKERQLCLDKLQWTTNGPVCFPTDTPQPAP